MTREDDERKVRKAVGSLAGDILIRGFSVRQGLEATLRTNPAFRSLINGDVTGDVAKKVILAIKENEPLTLAMSQLEGAVNPTTLKELRAYVSKGDVSGMVSYLLSQSKDEIKNPFAYDPKEVAKRLIGAPITFMPSLSELTTGIIKQVGVYSGSGEKDNFTLHKTAPGTIGVWTGAGTTVACISSHEIGSQGYIALFSTLTDGKELKMRDISGKFGFTDNLSKSLIDSESNLRIMLHDGKPLGGYTISSGDKKKKGTGCVAVYQLGAA